MNTTINNTIAAIATPSAKGGVAMVRISGENAIAVAEKVFNPVSGKRVSDMSGYTAVYGNIYDNGALIDDGVLLVYKAPKSYTGEDVAEITCHGGVFVAQRVLKACINAGADLAQAGEFTKRAVLNGKMTLTQAESVIDVINSANEQYLACANAQKNGSLYRNINEIADILLSASAHISAWLDYPEEGVEDFEAGEYTEKLDEFGKRLSLLVKSYDVAATTRDGVVTAIVGKPNAGKSTLMNLLTRRERSIVTDIPGTTRDIVEETVSLNGTVLRLCDCAGIRETADTVERIGIEYMYRQIDESSLVLAVFDNSRALEKDDHALIERIAGKTCICIINKCDLPCKLDVDLLADNFKHIIKISAKDMLTTGITDGLASVIGEVYESNTLDLSAGFIANERQCLCVKEAEAFVVQAVDGLKSGALPIDAVGFLIENALDALYRLSGKSVSDEIIDEVFRSFCVGK